MRKKGNEIPKVVKGVSDKGFVQGLHCKEAVGLHGSVGGPYGEGAHGSAPQLCPSAP